MTDTWQSTAPNKPGSWWMKCWETGGEPELVDVQKRNGTLYAVDCAIGTLRVKDYHEGLCDCQWKRVD